MKGTSMRVRFFLWLLLLLLLDRVYVPRPFMRPRVLSGVLARAVELLLPETSEIIMFTDADKEAWVNACQEVGFESKERYRMIMLR